jgi:hypothetical protein
MSGGSGFRNCHKECESSRASECDSERAAAVVESAIMLSLLLILLLGIMEASLLMMNRSNVKSSVHLASRAGSIAANDPDADYAVLRELRKSLSDQVGTVEYVIVFNANGISDGQPPMPCLASAQSGSAGIGGLCNVYSQAQVANPDPNSFGYDALLNPTALADKNWPARRRAATYSQGRDLIGVYLRTESRSITGLIPRSAMSTSVVLRLEARGV